MNELAIHIEYLLLSHNCVIVPTLGAFHTMLTPARWIARESLFLPPVRNVHFDSSITDDPDAVFLQSLSEIYDLTPEQALKHCEEMVAEFHKMLVSEGTIDFGSIGVFTLEDDAEITMASCECGVLTPYYYGLDALHMQKLADEPANKTLEPYITRPSSTTLTHKEKTITGKGTTSKIQQEEVETAAESITADQTTTEAEAEEVTSTEQLIILQAQPASQESAQHITIKLHRKLVNFAMAIACAIALFFIIKPTTIHSEKFAEDASIPAFLQPNMVMEKQDVTDPTLDSLMMVEETDTFDAVLVDVTQVALNEGYDFDNKEDGTQALTSTEQHVIEIATPTKSAENNKVGTATTNTVQPSAKVTAEKPANDTYCIVLASSISKTNAQNFVERLQKQQINAKVYESGNMRRVIIDGFNSYNEAHTFMAPLKKAHSDLSSAWVLKL